MKVGLGSVDCDCGRAGNGSLDLRLRVLHVVARLGGRP